MIAIAGCSDGGSSQNDISDSDGDGVIDSEDYAPQDPDVQEKSDIQSPGTSSPAETATPTEAETPTETATPTVRSNKRQALIEYRAGKEFAESADDWHGEAAKEYDNGKYEQAEQAYQTATEDSREAERRFDEAADLARYADRQEAEEIANTASAYMSDVFIPFSDAAKAAAVAQQRYGPERAERYEEDAQEYIEEAEKRQNNDNHIAETAEFREALGLD
jgi:hypothetical protein